MRTLIYPPVNKANIVGKLQKLGIINISMATLL